MKGECIEKSNYNIITDSMIETGHLPENFSILDYVPSEHGAQGELEAVMVRMPRIIMHPFFVNEVIACVIKRGAEDYSVNGPLSKKVKKAIETINSYEPVTIADRVLSLMYKKNDEVARRKKNADFARFLIEEGDTLQSVKFGLAMLGVFGEADNEDDIKLVKTLGCCDEFTFFSVKTLTRLLSGNAFNEAAVTLMAETRGWGKIAAVLELPDKIDDEKLRLAILAKGAKNELGLYHLAAECAIKGGLNDYLLNMESENEKMPEIISNGICDIFDGLFEAEKLDGDSFNEVPNINLIITDFCLMYERGLISGTAADIYERLKNR